MFPVQYPNNAAPSFQFINPTSITASMKAKLLKVRGPTARHVLNTCCLDFWHSQTLLKVYHRLLFELTYSGACRMGCLLALQPSSSFSPLMLFEHFFLCILV